MTGQPVVRTSTAPALAVGAVFTYMVLVGGTAVGETHPVLRLLNAAIGGVFIAIYVARLPSSSDRIDRLILAAALLFAFAGLVSSLPRQSLDAVVSVFALAAATYTARQLGNSGAIRWAVLTCMRAMSVMIVALTLVRWVPPLIDWWNLAGVLPPLDLDFHAHPWGHRHDLTLLVVMLYPSWLAPTPSSLRGRLVALGMGAMTGVIVVLDGSRALWLALAIATAIVVAPPSYRFLHDRNLLRPALAAVAVVVVVGLFTGLFSPIIERVLDFHTLRARGSMWSALLEAWHSSPIAGLGPGTFVWDLQRTNYFDAASWAPRHPDSAIFQLLAEAGATGVIAATLVVAALAPRVLGQGNSPARWAILAFAFAGIGNNPTDFMFLVLVAVAWVGLLVPRLGSPLTRDAPSSWMRRAYVVLLAALAGVTALSSAATFAYESARVAVARGDLVDAQRDFTSALRLDPGHALYSRQRGIGRLLTGDLAGALSDLQRATQLSPTDDLAWRALAITLREAGDRESAYSALSHALRSQRSDLTNLLISVRWNATDGQTAVAESQLAEVLLAVPGLLTAPGWQDLTAGLSADIADLAIARWQAGARAPAPIRTQPAELVGWKLRTDLVDEASEASDLEDQLDNAMVAVFSCGPQSSQLLAEVDVRLRRLPDYWRLVVASSARQGRVSDIAVRLLAIMSGNPPSPLRDARLNPLNENTGEGFSADAWGYERNPIEWQSWRLSLPSPAEGQRRWIYGDGEADMRPLLCHTGR